MIAVTIFYICVIGFWWAHRSYRAEKRYWESCDRQGKREHSWAELENALLEPYDNEPKNAGGEPCMSEPKNAGAAVYDCPACGDTGVLGLGGSRCPACNPSDVERVQARTLIILPDAYYAEWDAHLRSEETT